MSHGYERVITPAIRASIDTARAHLRRTKPATKPAAKPAQPQVPDWFREPPDLAEETEQETHP